MLIFQSPFGSALAGVDEIRLSAADGSIVQFSNNELTRAAFQLIGLPHIGLRLRARHLLDWVPQSGARMLDAGCGNGIYSLTLASRFSRIDAVDIDKRKIKYFNQSHLPQNLHASSQDLTHLNFPDHSFDFIILSEVLEHVQNERLVLLELSRVLRPGGKLLLTVPVDSPYTRRSYPRWGHQKAGYSVLELESLCQSAGLSMLRYEGFSRGWTESIVEAQLAFLRYPLVMALLFWPLYALALLGECFNADQSPSGLLMELGLQPVERKKRKN